MVVLNSKLLLVGQPEDSEVEAELVRCRCSDGSGEQRADDRKDQQQAEDAAGLWRRWPSPTSRSNPKQNLGAVRRLVQQRHTAFGIQDAGPIVLPRHKLVVCVPPKNGCTSVKRLLLRLQGVLSPSEMCQPKFGFRNPMDMVHRVLPTKLVDRQKDWPMRYRMAWSDAYLITNALNDEIQGVFTSPEWTTIAVTRDPWERAVSQFNDQTARSKSGLGVRGWRENKELSKRDNFLNFTDSRMGDGHHTAEQSVMCGFTHVQYDYVIPMENLSGGFDTLIRHGVLAENLVRKGWENCTAGGSPGIFESRSVTHGGHVHMSTGQDAQHEVVCDSDTAQAVYERYRRDYAFFKRMGMNYAPPKCSPPAED
eukprot:CAMPEP_0178376984 /NCGR_PEP_ID=MMETSP0689_2-20121128/3685_1 /TAXON_ID=160604 /ORGANISM="Amphidinium massartii, Strain CS-259" /LENGTH=365 /DNA_ID=CAMNT_0019997025 /DNA_START=84 /DNA_END=1181 /DNA_ORIENTATION=-